VVGHIPAVGNHPTVNSTCVTPKGADQLDELGFCILADAVTPETVDELTACLGKLTANDATMPAAGVRDVAALVPSVARFACSAEVSQMLHSLGAPNAFPVRSIFFDKQPGANWKVPWHQDLTIAVRARMDLPEFGPWSEKAGIPHVQPPAEILERMLTLRLHLDDCDAGNGALKVIPGSHRNGVLRADAIQQHRQARNEQVCAVPRGGILAMRPLLLHASSPAIRPHHRRVIHLEYATAKLPRGLDWFEQVQPRSAASAPSDGAGI